MATTNNDKGVVLGVNNLIRTGLGADLTITSNTITITDRVHYITGAGTINTINVSGGNPTGTTDVYLIRKTGATVVFSVSGGNINGLVPNVSDNVPIYGVWDGTNWKLSAIGTPSAFGTQSANNVLAGPTTGAAATPVFRTFVSADIPDSVALTGAPTAPTAAPGTNTTQLASTAFSAAAIAALIANTQTVAGTWTFTPGLRERGRTTALGEAIGFTPTLTASAGTFSSANIVTANYSLVGKQMTVAVLLGSCTISTTPTSLFIAIPGGFTASLQTWTSYPWNDSGGSGTGVAKVVSGGTTIELVKSISAPAFAATAGSGTVAVTFTFYVN